MEDIYEHFTAEIIVDNYRFEVTPTEIPFELVQYQAQKLGTGCDDDDDANYENVEFTPDIGLAIVNELLNSAKELGRFNEERKTKNQSEFSKTTEQLIQSLKESHRRTLLTCAGGLQDYVEQQQIEEINEGNTKK